MKKGLMLAIAFIVVTVAQAQQTKMGTGSIGTTPMTKPVGSEVRHYGHGPVISEPIGTKSKYWKVSMITPLKNKSNQLEDLTDNAIMKINQANTFEQLKNGINNYASKLTNLKSGNQFLTSLATDLKNLISKNNNDVIIASKTLHKQLTELPIALQKENMMDLSKVSEKLHKLYVTTANKIVAIKLQEAKQKSGKAQDDAIIGGLVASPLHLDKETLQEYKKSLNLLEQLQDLKQKSKGAQEGFMEIQTKTLDLQEPGFGG